MPSTAIQKLYDKIPKFSCKEGCTDCCGPIPFSRSEWADVTVQRKATSVHCPYIIPLKERKNPAHGCAIYENRPFMCRIFASAEDPGLRCPHGCKPEKPLTAQEASKLTSVYTTIIRLEEM